MKSMFGRRKNDTNYGAIIDIHSGSVGIAILYSNHAEKDPEILFTHREEIKILENPGTENRVRALLRALFGATLQFSQEGVKALKEHNSRASIGKVLLVCGAPWAQTATRFITIEEKEPFLITEDKIRALILEAERRDEEEFKATMLLKELSVSLVESAVVHTTVNGYPVSNPYGKKAKEVTLAHISGLIPQAITQAIDDIKEKTLTETHRTSHTFALVLFCVLRDLYPLQKHAVIIDISGEATEICLMQDEVLLETHVFPYGTHTFIRDLAVKLHTFPEEALTHLREYSPETRGEIKKAIDEIAKTYTTYLHDSYTSLAERYTIPKHFYLTTSKELDIFFDTLVRKASESYMQSHGTCTSLNEILTVQNTHTNAPVDVFFAVEARFFHKMHSCGEIT